MLSSGLAMLSSASRVRSMLSVAAGVSGLTAVREPLTSTLGVGSAAWASVMQHAATSAASSGGRWRVGGW